MTLRNSVVVVGANGAGGMAVFILSKWANLGARWNTVPSVAPRTKQWRRTRQSVTVNENVSLVLYLHFYYLRGKQLMATSTAFGRSHRVLLIIVISHAWLLAFMVKSILTNSLYLHIYQIDKSLLFYILLQLKSQSTCFKRQFT